MGLAATIRYSWRDASGSVGYTTAHVPDAMPVAAARLAADALAGSLRAATGCSLTGYSIQYNEHVSDARRPGVARVYDVLVLVLFDGGDNYSVIELPGVLGIFDELGQVDPLPPAVAALAARLAAAPFCNPFGIVCGTVEAAYYEFDPV